MNTFSALILTFTSLGLASTLAHEGNASDQGAPIHRLSTALTDELESVQELALRRMAELIDNKHPSAQETELLAAPFLRPGQPIALQKAALEVMKARGAEHIQEDHRQQVEAIVLGEDEVRTKAALEALEAIGFKNQAVRDIAHKWAKSQNPETSGPAIIALGAAKGATESDLNLLVRRVIQRPETADDVAKALAFGNLSAQPFVDELKKSPRPETHEAITLLQCIGAARGLSEDDWKYLEEEWLKGEWFASDEFPTLVSEVMRVFSQSGRLPSNPWLEKDWKPNASDESPTIAFLEMIHQAGPEASSRWVALLDLVIRPDAAPGRRVAQKLAQIVQAASSAPGHEQEYDSMIARLADRLSEIEDKNELDAMEAILIAVTPLDSQESFDTAPWEKLKDTLDQIVKSLKDSPQDGDLLALAIAARAPMFRVDPSDPGFKQIAEILEKKPGPDVATEALRACVHARKEDAILNALRGPDRTIARLSMEALLEFQRTGGSLSTPAFREVLSLSNSQDYYDVAADILTDLPEPAAEPLAEEAHTLAINYLKEDAIRDHLRLSAYYLNHPKGSLSFAPANGAWRWALSASLAVIGSLAVYRWRFGQLIRRVRAEDKVSILFLAANPKGTFQVNLQKEHRQIEEKIRDSKYRDSLELISAWAVQPDDLLRELNEHQPHIVHFSGHGSEGEEIVLEDDKGKPFLLSKSALTDTFGTMKENIRLVVMNACYSKAQAEAIVEHIDCAIGMKTAIGDEAAILFSAAFYRALGFGKSVKDAFGQGTLAMKLAEREIPEEDTPELIVRKGVDASKVILVNAKKDS